MNEAIMLAVRRVRQNLVRRIRSGRPANSGRVNEPHMAALYTVDVPARAFQGIGSRVGNPVRP